MRQTKRNRPKKEPKSFEEIVKEISSIKNCYNKGLDALDSKDRKDIRSVKGKFCGSVFLDECQTGPRPEGEKRWDYIICHSGKLYFVEVHSAQTTNVSELEGKAKMLNIFLSGEGAALKALKDPAFPNIWLASPKTKVDIRHAGITLTGADRNRYLAQKGLVLYTKLEFPLKPKV